MRYRKLGRTGFQVSEISFGAWGIGGDWWAGAVDEESLHSIQLALDLGVNFIDTAPNYGNGHSEELVGRAVRDWRSLRMRDRPEQVVVATKVNPKNYTWPAAPGTPLSQVFPQDWIIQSTEKSLKTLGLDCIDLQQFHVWLDEWAEQDEWKEAVVRLKQDGKVRAFGISLNYPLEPDYGAEAIRTGLIDACQVVYNIYEQVPADGLFPLALQENVGIIVKSPLDEGALTGKITPDTVFPEGSFQDFYFKGDRKREVWERARAIESALPGDVATLAEAALRFCLGHPAVSTLIVGMRKPEHTRQNVQASDKGPLPEEDLKALKVHAWPHNFWV
jgi:aryl-alcohol dehydrogenase-like predicted oxidoreductase